MRYVLDTHAAVWNALAPAYLGAFAARTLLSAKPSNLLISDVTLSEVARLIVARKIKPQGNPDRWLEAFAALHTVVPVNPLIAWTAAAYTFTHKDPCDRHILATAQSLNMPLVTVDDQLTKLAPTVGVHVIW